MTFDKQSLYHDVMGDCPSLDGWRVWNHSENKAHLMVIAGNGHVVCRLGDTWHPCTPEQECAALVIGVAPDLLALARAIAEHFDGTDAPLGKQARELIAKATA